MPAHYPALRMSQSLPAALLSLAYFAASSTTAFVLGPRSSSLVTSATTSSRRSLLFPTSAYRRSMTSTSRHHHLSPASSTRLVPTSTSSAFLTSTSTSCKSSGSNSSRGRDGGVRSLKSVAAPAGLERQGISSGLDELLSPRNGVNERFVFFGGKGGVGKTSTAAAVAIQCADAGLRSVPTAGSNQTVFFEEPALIVTVVVRQQ